MKAKALDLLDAETMMTTTLRPLLPVVQTLFENTIVAAAMIPTTTTLHVAITAALAIDTPIEKEDTGQMSETVAEEMMIATTIADIAAAAEATHPTEVTAVLTATDATETEIGTETETTVTATGTEIETETVAATSRIVTVIDTEATETATTAVTAIVAARRRASPSTTSTTLSSRARSTTRPWRR